MTSRTQNNALTHITSGSSLVDLYFRLIDGIEDSEIHKLIEGAWREDKRSTAVLLFDLRNCRGGKGRYNLFAKSMCELLSNVELSNETIQLWTGLIPRYGSFKDFWRILEVLPEFTFSKYSSVKTFRDSIIDSYCESLSNDCKNYFGLTISEYDERVKSGIRPPPALSNTKNISLASKYAPKPKNHYKGYFLSVVKKLGMTEKSYRWMCADLRERLNIIEVTMSANKWEEINYSTIPSVALKKYLKAFKKHSPEAFEKYMNRVKSGEVKACVKQVYPHQYVHDMLNDINTRENDILFGEYVKQMGSVFNDTVVIIDTSASMKTNLSGGVRPIDIAITMGLLVSWSSTGPFEQKYIQFSSNSDISAIIGDSWYERVNCIYTKCVNENTNLQSATDRLIESRANVKYVLIVSDMQFDEADYGNTNFDTIKERYEDEGMEMPTYVFWNVSGICKDCPVTQNENGVILISGYSPSILKMIYEVGPSVSPNLFIENLINSEMYRPVQLP